MCPLMKSILTVLSHVLMKTALYPREVEEVEAIAEASVVMIAECVEAKEVDTEAVSGVVSVEVSAGETEVLVHCEYCII